MAATMDIYEFNDVGPTGTIKTNSTVRFKKADNAVVDSNNPLVKPTNPNYDRSFVKSLRLFCTNAGTGTTTAVNPRFYASGAPGTGIALYAKTTSTSSYTRATASPSNETGYSDVATNYYDTSHTLALGAGGTFSTGNVPQNTNYLEIYMRIESTVSPGTSSGVTFTMSWDES